MSMVPGWRPITLPTEEILSVEEAKSHLRITYSQEDNDIQALIKAATEYVESKGHMLAPQQWDMLLDQFPCYSDEPILVTKNPVESVESITYVDTDGVTQTWDSGEYQLARGQRLARILPLYPNVYPYTRYQLEAVSIRLNLGYYSSPMSVPQGILQAMKLLIGHLYENREAVIVLQGVVSLELPLGLEALLDQLIGGARAY